MPGVFARIALRYVVGALIATGAIYPEFGEYLIGDPEVAAAIQIGGGVLIGVAVELFWRIAKRMGWET